MQDRSTDASPAERIRFGPAGWSYADWKGAVYPQPRPKGFHPLVFLARYFNFVEVNSTFYTPPRAKDAQAWVDRLAQDRVPADALVFAFKVTNRFTHADSERERSALTAADAREFMDGIAPIATAGRAGPLLLQFPFFFTPTPDNVAHLTRLCDFFTSAGDWPLVVELRDRDWMTPGRLEALAQLPISLAGIDMPQSRTSPDPRFWPVGRIGYLRLHGRNATTWFDPKAPVWAKYDYLYRREELTPWVERICDEQTQGKPVFVAANNHYRGQGLTNALQIVSALENAPIPVPETLRSTYPAAFRDVAIREEPRRRTLFD